MVPIDRLSVALTLIRSVLLLHEQFTWKSGVGAFLLTVGTLVMAWRVEVKGVC